MVSIAQILCPPATESRAHEIRPYCFVSTPMAATFSPMLQTQRPSYKPGVVKVVVVVVVVKVVVVVAVAAATTTTTVVVPKPTSHKSDPQDAVVYHEPVVLHGVKKCGEG